jgi:hypothetical protein
LVRALYWTDGYADNYNLMMPFAVSAAAPFNQLEVVSVGDEMDGFNLDHSEVRSSVMYDGAPLGGEVGPLTLDEESAWPFGMGIPEVYPNALYQAGFDNDAFRWRAQGADLDDVDALSFLPSTSRTVAQASLSEAPHASFDHGQATVSMASTSLLIRRQTNDGSTRTIRVNADLSIPAYPELRDRLVEENDLLVLVPDVGAIQVVDIQCQIIGYVGVNCEQAETALLDLVIENFVAELPLMQQAFNGGALYAPADVVAEATAEAGWLNVYFDHDDADTLGLLLDVF